MRKEYDLSKLEGRKNPYAERLRKEVRIHLEDETVEYFRHLSLTHHRPSAEVVQQS